MTMRVLRALLLGLALLAPINVHAVQPDEILPDAAMEARARELSAQLRCMVCQNQSIDDSDAPLAKDLRVLVRERLKAGDSDSAIMKYLTERYGDFILLSPPFKAHTLLLWTAPLLVLLLGGGAILIAMRKRRPAVAAQGLSADEQARLKAVLGDEQ